MSWDTVYTAGARRDLRNLYEYIVNDLCVENSSRTGWKNYGKDPFP